MGALQCQVRVLKGRRPLLFSWENPIKKHVECILVTCPCQKLNLEYVTSEQTDDELFPAKDKAWISRLLKSLEDAEVVSFDSLDARAIVSSYMEVHEDLGEILTNEQITEMSKPKRRKYHRKFQRRRKKEKLKMHKIDVFLAGSKYDNEKHEETLTCLSAVDSCEEGKSVPGDYDEQTGGASTAPSSRGDIKSGELSKGIGQGRVLRNRENRKQLLDIGSSVVKDSPVVVTRNSTVFNLLKGLPGGKVSEGITNVSSLNPLDQEEDKSSPSNVNKDANCSITTGSSGGTNSSPSSGDSLRSSQLAEHLFEKQATDKHPLLTAKSSEVGDNTDVGVANTCKHFEARPLDSSACDSLQELHLKRSSGSSSHRNEMGNIQSGSETISSEKHPLVISQRKPSKETTETVSGNPLPAHAWLDAPLLSGNRVTAVTHHEMPEASLNLVTLGEMTTLSKSCKLAETAKVSSEEGISNRAKIVSSTSRSGAFIDVGVANSEIQRVALDPASSEDLEELPQGLAASAVGSSSLSEENALMEAIDSMVKTMSSRPDTGNNQSRQLQARETLLADDASNFENISVPSTRVEFIRSLTDDERKKMFNFRSDIDERNRKALETGEGAYLCEHCGKVLSMKAIRGHMKTHAKNRERTEICDVCGKAFMTNFALKNHLRTHDPNHIFKCHYCPKSYKSKFGRTMHERLHFGVYPETCKQCGDKFNESHRLRLHMEDVHGEKPKEEKRAARAARPKPENGDKGTSTCQVCHKVLRTWSLRQHMEVHAGKTFTCPTCGKVMKFATRFTHLKLHKAEKDFRCSHCPKTFATKQSLACHERVHTGERHLQCRYCDRKFARYSSREVHENAHTGERPYKCTICEKAWKDRSSYRTHMRKNHPGEPLFYKRWTAEVNSKRGHNWPQVFNTA